MAEVFIDKIKGKVFTKEDGVVKEARVLSKMPVADPINEPSAEQLAQQELLNAENLLKQKIKDIKEKNELLELGVVTVEEYDAKKAEYKPLKDAYEALKIK